MYPNIRCIVTCRPHASLGMSLTADAEIRLKGFSKQQARHYVDMYFRQKYPSNTKLAELESRKLWNDIESSPDLLEMSINPSMLQLVCKMFSVTGKIAIDLATVFKDYTYFLLQQMHVKLHKKPLGYTELKNMYRGILLKAGHLALQGLKQSHLQLIFTKESVIELAGKVMFEIGFVTEVPGHGIEKPKAQFQHKTHQEYLAAYFIVESPNNVGIKYLMEFCSTSKGLMGSKIILTFITSMSKKMGRVIQKKIRELVSSWKSEDDISPKDRTSFLLTMLMENNSLSFPLPKEIDINVREYEESIGLFQKISQKFGKKGALETFFTFDNRGVEKITMVLGKEYRLELMKDFDKSQLQDVSVNFQKKSFQKDLIHLTHLIQNNEKLKILSLAQLSTQDLLYLNKKSEFTSCLKKSNHLEIIKISECEPDIKTDLTDVFKHFPSHLELNISGNRFANMSGCKALVKKAAHQKALIMQDCGIIIDTEIAEAISQLPENSNLDLSGNTVTKMDNSLLCHVIPVISNKSIDLSGLGLVIDEKVAKVLSSLPKEVKVNLSGNQITDKSVCSSLIYKAATMKSLSICNCGIQIETEVAEAVSRLPDHTQLDLSGNELSNMKPDLLSRVLTYMTRQQEIDLNEWEITVDANIVRAISKLSKLKTINIISPNGKFTNQAAAEFPHTVSSMPDLLSLSLVGCGISNDVAVALTDSLSKDCHLLQGLDLSDNNLSSAIEKSVKHMKQMRNLKTIFLANCGISNDVAVALTDSLSKHWPQLMVLDLSDNNLSSCMKEVLKHIQEMENLEKLILDNCGIQINTEIAEALSRLPDHTQLNLSSNQVTDKSACIKLIHKATTMKSLSIRNCGIQIDTEIAEAVSRLPDHTKLDLSGNELSNMKPDLLSRVLTYMTKQEKIGIKRWEITVDANIVRAISKLSKLKTINIISPNGKLTNQAAAEFPHTVSFMPHLLSLNLVGCDIGNDVAVALTDSLSKHCPQLEILSLSYNDLSSGIKESVKHIEQMKNLKALYLSNCGINNDGVVALTESLSKHCPLLKVLNLSDNNLSSGIKESVKHIQQMKNLKALYLSNCGINNDVMVILTDSLSKDCPQLQVLSLSDNNVSSGIEEFVRHIELMKNLEDLYLSNCGINNDVVVALTESLSKHCPLLKVLNLSDNNLSSGIEELVKHLQQMKNLEVLSLDNCGIGNDVAVALTNSLFKHCPQLKILNLNDNDLLSGIEESVKHIEHVKKLEELYISNCGISNDVAVALTDSLSKHCPQLQVLDLGDNDLSSGMEDALKHIQQMKNLKKLFLDNCAIQIDTEIAEAVSRHPDHTELNLSGNQVTDKSACIILIHKAVTMTSLSICNCCIQIDTEIAEAVSRVPDHTQLDLSGNELSKMKPDLLSRVLTCMTSQQEIDLNEWEITVDANIVRAISKLSKLKTINIISPNGKFTNQAAAEFPHTVSSMPDLLSLSLFGCDISNDVAVALTGSLSKHCHLLQGLDLSDNNLSSGIEESSKHLQKMKNLKALFLSNCGISNDVAVALTDSLSKHCPQLNVLDLSHNNLSSCMEKMVKNIQEMENLEKLILDNCGIQINTEIAEALSRLPDHTQLNLSSNQVTDKSACITLIHKATTMKSLSICNCSIEIDTEIAQAVSRLPDHTQLYLSGNQVTDKSACITLIHKAATMESLNLCNCGIQIDTDIAEAVSRLPDNTELDLSGNEVTDKSACITLVHKAATMESINLCNCDIQIDTDIAEAVSRLPDDTELDLSGNQVTDKSACITLVHKAATMESLNLCNCGIQIDTEIAEAVSRLPDDTQLDLSGNQVTDKSACITLIHNAATMKFLIIHDCIYNCGIQIDTEIAEAVSRLPDYTQLDLSGNQVTDKSVSITLIQKAASMKLLNIHNCMSNCGIEIDTEMAEAVSRLSDNTQLDLSGNKVTDKSVCITLIHKAATMKTLNMHDCITNSGIQIDTEIAEAVSRIPDHTQLDLSGNLVTDKSACITLIHKAATMESLNICNCGIQIDTEIAEAVSRLPDDTELDLSGNQVTDKSACITLIHNAATMKFLTIHDCMYNCGIEIDTEIAKAVSRLPDYTELDLSGNHIRQMESFLLLRILTYMKKQERINIDEWGIKVDESIVRALSKLSNLQTIIINDGYSNNNNTLTSIASSELPHTVSSIPHLQDLYLDYCDISNYVMVALTDSLYKHCPLLEKLSLGHNHLSSGVWEVVTNIQQMKNLRWLWLSGNPCMKDEKERHKIKITLHRSHPGLHINL